MPSPLHSPPRVVVDCQFFIDAVTLTAEQRRQGERPNGWRLIEAFTAGYFLWTWEAEILEEYERTATWLIRYRRPGDPTIDKASVRRILRDIRTHGLEIEVPDDIYAVAWHTLMDPHRPETLRDQDDVIYAATAHAAEAAFLLSRDRSLTSLGPNYQAVPIIRDLAALLQRVGFPV